ncbi:MAG: hypothetical protein ACOC93_01590 [Planctomycetota bacterium]
MQRITVSAVGLAMCGVVAAVLLAGPSGDASPQLPAGPSRQPLTTDEPVTEFERMLEADRLAQWDDLSKTPKNFRRDDVPEQTFRQAALRKKEDRDGLDIVLRRTRALLEHLEGMDQAPDLAAEQRELAALAATAAEVAPDRTDHRKELYLQACRLRRRIAFANPLLDFDRLLFLKRHLSHANHMCDQYFGHKAKRGGGLFVLFDLFGEQPRIRDVLKESVVQSGRLAGQKLTGAAFLSPELSYDGREIIFASCECRGGAWNEGSTWNIFRVGVDGRGLVQLTDGPMNDFDPLFLPNGRICFISERRGGFGRCHGRPVPTYTLHSMLPDGSDIAAVSYHETNEWHPSVNNDGLIVYSRWDYVDRDSDIAHHPWITTPDGRDARALHGNYPRDWREGDRHHDGRRDRPWMELDVKPIPGSHRYVAVAAPHHGQAFGSLVLLDPDIEDDDACSQLQRITPDVAFPESQGGRWAFATPWPLSEDFYLATYKPNQEGLNFGLYLVDSFGNRLLLYRDEKLHCQSAMPLRPRPRPPVLPHLTATAHPPARKSDGGPEQTSESAGQGGPSAEATVAVMDVYDGLLPWPEGTNITALRVVQVFPKATPKSDRPRIGMAKQSLARGVLGTVPVEADGSAHFKVPAGKTVYFQALDAKGRAVQSMRSDTYLQPGQRLSCQGCHEPRHVAPEAGREVPLALRREPSELRPEMDGSNPVLYTQLVQPVLDDNCVSCHRQHDDAPDLSDKSRGGWTESYQALAKRGDWYSGGNGTMRRLRDGGSRTRPGEFGALGSELYEILAGGHHDVELTEEEMRRLTLWLDTNCNFLGAYREVDRQRRGESVEPEIE